jgi:hypothetical protein
MSAKNEADIMKLQEEVSVMRDQLFSLNAHFLAAINAVVERIEHIEGGDPPTKAAPNGKAKKTTHGS